MDSSDQGDHPNSFVSSTCSKSQPWLHGELLFSDGQMFEKVDGAEQSGGLILFKS